MNVITKFSALGLAAVLFAACSDSASDNGGDNLSPEVTGIGLSTTGGSTVTNYKTNGTAKAPRRYAALSIPEEATAPADAEDIKTLSGTVVGKSVVVTGDYTVPAGVTFQGCTVYVQKGTLTFSDLDNATAQNTIVVNHNGTLNHTGSKTINATVYCYGVFTQENGTTLEIGGKFYINDNLSVAKTNCAVKVDNGATLYCAKSLRAANLTVEEGATVEATDAYLEDYALVNNGVLTLAGHLNVKDATLGKASVTTVGKWVFLSSSLTMDGSAKLQANSIDASAKKDSEGNVVDGRTAKMSGSSSIVVNETGYLTFDKFEAKENSKVSVNGEGSVAVFKARDFYYDKENVQLFQTASNNSTFLLELTKMTLNGTEVAFEDAVIDASYYDYAKAQAYDGIKEAEWDKEEGYKMNKTDYNALPKLDLIATVENASPDYMSATCIAPFNNNLYVSYHTRGNQHGANIEVFKVNGNQVSLTQSLKDNANALDFNHCMVADNRLYLSGSHVNAGGGFGYIALDSDGKLNTTATTINGKTREPLQFVSVIDKLTQKTDVDANSAVKYGSSIVLATTAGYSYFAETTNSDGETVWSRNATATAGKAKSVIVVNNKLCGLNFAAATSDDTTPVDGTLNWTSNATLDGANTLNVGKIAPTNGKNTISADAAGNVYVCKGQYGLQQVLAEGTPGWTWTVPTNKSGNVKGYANGVTADDNYVYVACGGYGLVILDKATGKELCHRSVGASANYVAVNNGYIYVANGKNRVQMFKLNYTK